MGVFLHGMGNWERMRQDPRLHFEDKFPLPAGAASAAAVGAVKLPKPSLLEARAGTLLRKVREALVVDYDTDTVVRFAALEVNDGAGTVVRFAALRLTASCLSAWCTGG